MAPISRCDADELRTLFLFEKLTDEQLRTLCAVGEIAQYDAGCPICHRRVAIGDPFVRAATTMELVTHHDGELRLLESRGESERGRGTRAFAAKTIKNRRPSIAVRGGATNSWHRPSPSASSFPLRISEGSSA